MKIKILCNKYVFILSDLYIKGKNTCSTFFDVFKNTVSIAYEYFHLKFVKSMY